MVGAKFQLFNEYDSLVTYTHFLVRTEKYHLLYLLQRHKNYYYKMIDVSQWRASIGLWNYCQAASSRPANGHNSHSFKTAVDNKSGSTKSGENKTSKLPAALPLIVLLVASLFKFMKLICIPPTGKQTN